MNPLDALQRIFQRETASMAQYLVQIWPWAEPERRAAKELVERIAAEEQQWCSRLAELVDACDGVPLCGSFPSSYRSLHYLAVTTLLPRLADYLRANIELFRQDLAAFGNDPQVRSLLEEMLQAKEWQLQAVQELSPQLRKAG